MTVRRFAIVFGVVIVASMVVYARLAAVLADPRPSVLGVRLGMTADELRAHVDALESGSWTSSLHDGDWVLDRRAGELTARFELHQGQLVAVRVEGPRSASLPESPRFEVTPGSVLVRVVDGARVRITLLSRACPTHHDEAETLVRSNVSAL